MEQGRRKRGESVSVGRNVPVGVKGSVALRVCAYGRTFKVGILIRCYRFLCDDEDDIDVHCILPVIVEGSLCPKGELPAPGEVLIFYGRITPQCYYWMGKSDNAYSDVSNQETSNPPYPSRVTLV